MSLFWRCRTHSVTPGISAHTGGTPHAMASSRDMGDESRLERDTNTSAIWKKLEELPAVVPHPPDEAHGVPHAEGVDEGPRCASCSSVPAFQMNTNFASGTRARIRGIARTRMSTL